MSKRSEIYVSVQRAHGELSAAGKAYLSASPNEPMTASHRADILKWLEEIADRAAWLRKELAIEEVYPSEARS